VKLDLLLKQYPEVFKEQLDLRAETEVKLVIKLAGEYKAPYCYQVPNAYRDRAEAKINEMIDSGILRPSASQFQSPLVCVPKKDGKLRLCVDYRALNAVTVPDSYTLPSIEYIKQHITGNIFTSLDLREGFMQVAIEEADRHKTAVKTPWGLFEFNRMPFGLRNAPPTFQRFMNTVLHGIKNIFVYIDDVVVYSRSYDEHFVTLDLVLTRLQQHGLIINSQKSSFVASEICYLGMIFDEEGYRAVETTLPKIRDYPVPADKKGVQKFLGVINYYRSHIPNLATIAVPLYWLLNKSNKFIWTDKQQTAFEELKRLFDKRLRLYPLQTTGQIELYTDASDVACGAVLTQDSKPIEFFSRTMTAVECRYSTFERETLAMVASILHYRNILIGTPFTLWTDHKPLQSWLLKPPKTERHARWLVKLQDFDFVIKHIEGEKNVLADLMSRPAGLEKVSFEELDQALNSGESPKMIAVNAVSRLGFEDEIALAQTPKFIKECGVKDDKLLKKGGLYYAAGDCGQCLIVPHAFRERVVSFIHQLGHYGRKRTLQLVKASYYWAGLNADVLKYVACCDVCQVNKKSKIKKRVWQKYPITSRFKTVHVDLVGPLQKSSKGRSYIFTMIDRYSRWMEAVPLANIRASDCAQSFYDVWVTRFGVPDVVVSDQGAQFESFIYNDMLSRLGARHVRTTAYHPQTNGKVERSHATIKNILRCLSAHRADWDNVLPSTMMAMRTAINDTGTSPSLLVFGEHLTLPNLAITNERTYPEEEVSDFIIKLREDLAVLREFVTEVTDDPGDPMVKPTFPHEYVWILDPILKNSLSPKYKGPFKVISTQQYPVLLLDIDGVEKRINVDRVKPAPRLHELPPYTWRTDGEGNLLPLEPHPDRLGVSETVEMLVNSETGGLPELRTEDWIELPTRREVGSHGQEPTLSSGLVDSEPMITVPSQSLLDPTLLSVQNTQEFIPNTSSNLLFRPISFLSTATGQSLPNPRLITGSEHTPGLNNFTEHTPGLNNLPEHTPGSNLITEHTPGLNTNTGHTPSISNNTSTGHTASGHVITMPYLQQSVELSNSQRVTGSDLTLGDYSYPQLYVAEYNPGSQRVTGSEQPPLDLTFNTPQRTTGLGLFVPPNSTSISTDRGERMSFLAEPVITQDRTSLHEHQDQSLHTDNDPGRLPPTAVGQSDLQGYTTRYGRQTKPISRFI
jgi:hypothetical protein